jgi:endonuclease G
VLHEKKDGINPRVTTSSPAAPSHRAPTWLSGCRRTLIPSDDVLLDEHEYVVSYNPKKLDPNWSAWRLDRSYLGHVHRRDNFRADDSLPVNVYRVTPHDYLHSGYDRGHLCPSADREATPR